MSKIFRLYSGGSDSITDWTAINGHLGDTFINNIEDPAGDNARKQITSIPSPFARMDLVKTAFRYINSKKQPDGNTIYHRIVSEALDVAEIFFNARSLKNKIEIIAWNPGISVMPNGDIEIDESSDLGALVRSSNPKHALLGETIKMFLIQDRQTYNFSKLGRIYLLNSLQGPDILNIIGGTSPATLFFSSANDDIGSYMDIQFGDHKVFDTTYLSLAKRSEDFIRFLFSFKAAVPGFPTLFKEFDDYLNLSLQDPKFPVLVKTEIRTITPERYFANYDDVTLAGNEGFVVEILGNILKGYRPMPPSSDFEIDARKILPEGEKKPFVLPNEAFNAPLGYVNGIWKTDYRAPFKDARPINQRTLPYQDHVDYPYLTVSDLLEPYIIRLPYPVNKDKYFNGNFNESKYGYALPIKKELFKYFSIQDLIGTLPDGKKFFELQKLAGESVEAILRIPIKNGRYIKFSRMYTPNQFQDHIQAPDEETNKGVVVENQFGITVYPFLKTGVKENADYRVVLIDRDVLDVRSRNNRYEISLYSEQDPETPEPIAAVKTRSDKTQSHDATSIYHVVRREFDIIEVRPSSRIKGLLLPFMKTYNGGSAQFSFGIDFGTTNTHIEYRVDDGKIVPFEIAEKDIQMGSLHVNNSETDILLRDAKFGIGAFNIIELLPKEFLPEKIGANFDHKFPVRTIINEDKSLNLSSATYTLADFNVPFVYEKNYLPNNFKVSTNLKWANFQHTDDNKKRVEAFIEAILILIRNKVLLNGGNLAKTKIIWFYPSSMSEHRRNTLENAWVQATAKYIGKSVMPLKLSESIAPYYYFSKEAGIIALDKPVACIDIGGGTTDVVIYKDDAPVFLTSFKYAANSIFGDGYGNSMGSNGFIKKYYPILKDRLKNDDDRLYELNRAMEQIRENNSSIELITFFFSLDSNKAIRNGNYDISFSEILKHDEDVKILFVFFYASIIYHLAKLMKAKRMEPPRFITFSGMGSKVINLADANIGIRNLTEYTKLIFSDVYGETIGKIELGQYEEPKEITCKGGLRCTNFTDVDEIKTVLLGDENQTIVPDASLKYCEADNPELLNSVKAEVEQFIDRFFGWNDQFNYFNKFGAKPVDYEVYKARMKEDMMLFLKAGLKEKLDEVRENNKINVEETLFFYPLNGLLNKFAQTILSQTNN